MDEKTEGGAQPQRWSVSKRLEFIEFRLFWAGRVNRSDLVGTFSISPQQASADIAQYEEMAPQNLHYDRAQKTYLRSPDFVPRLVSSSSERYLLQLVAIARGWMQKDQTWFDAMPPVEVASLSRKPTDPSRLLHILDAIRNRLEIEIDYQSMTGAPALTRSIAPHSFAFSAERWYVRAWSREHNDFRDYNLNRIGAIRDAKPAVVEPSADFEWINMIDLIIAPNPGLPEAKRAAVVAEYNMVDEQLRVPCRISLSFYLMSEHNLDVEPGKLEPEKQQLVLINRDEVVQARKVARQLSVDALRRSPLKR